MHTKADASQAAADLLTLADTPGIQLAWQDTIRRGALLLGEWPVDAPVVENPPLDTGVSASSKAGTTVAHGSPKVTTADELRKGPFDKDPFDHDENGKPGGSKKKGHA